MRQWIVSDGGGPRQRGIVAAWPGFSRAFAQMAIVIRQFPLALLHFYPAMKYLRFVVLACLLAAMAPVMGGPQTPTPTPQSATTAPQARPKDVDSLEHIIAAVYDVISGPAASPRDWDR